MFDSNYSQLSPNNLCQYISLFIVYVCINGGIICDTCIMKWVYIKLGMATCAIYAN